MTIKRWHRIWEPGSAQVRGPGLGAGAWGPGSAQVPGNRAQRRRVGTGLSAGVWGPGSAQARAPLNSSARPRDSGLKVRRVSQRPAGRRPGHVGRTQAPRREEWATGHRAGSACRTPVGPSPEGAAGPRPGEDSRLRWVLGRSSGSGGHPGRHPRWKCPGPLGRRPGPPLSRSPSRAPGR